MTIGRYPLVLLVSMFVLGCAPKEPSYPLLDGGEIRFSELQGKVVFINYWAEWCTPCRIEVPELNALQKAFPDQVRVLGVNFDGVVGEELQQQASKMGIEFSLLVEDPRELFAIAPSGVLPETLVIDRRGEFQQVLLGPQSLETLLHVVASLPENMTLDE